MLAILSISVYICDASDGTKIGILRGFAIRIIATFEPKFIVQEMSEIAEEILHVSQPGMGINL